MRWSVVATAAVVLIASACGGTDAASTTVTSTTTTLAPAPPTTTSTTVVATSSSSTSAAVETLMAGSGSLGTYLTDAEGNTLYAFLPDEGAGESACYDQCEQNWPPLFERSQAGPGVDSALIGATTRADGMTQTTYNGWPLYYFVADTAPGETNGQGVGDVWYVMGVDGTTIR